MGIVIFSITMSLDGFVTGPNDRPGAGLGDGGEPLHNWVMGGEWTYEGEHPFAPHETDRAVLEELTSSLGAGIIGRRMFDVAGGWGGDPPGGGPVFVVTHHAPEDAATAWPAFTFVTDGIHSALEQAKAAAAGGDVSIGGGADIGQQYLRAGLVDELQITVAPILLGSGRRLFEHLGDTPIRLEQVKAVQSPFATHLRYRVTSTQVPPS